jgi:hypothetical protein
MPVVSPRSVPVAIPSPRAVPLPVPQRHGSVSVGSFHGGGSFQASSFHGASSLHGSISSLSDLMAVSPRMRSSHRSSGSVGSFGGPASLSNSFVLDPVATDSSDSWLQTQAGDIALESVPIIPATSGLEEATEVSIQ